MQFSTASAMSNCPTGDTGPNLRRFPSEPPLPADSKIWWSLCHRIASRLSDPSNFVSNAKRGSKPLDFETMIQNKLLAESKEQSWAPLNGVI
jgi:hypothetical protein